MKLRLDHLMVERALVPTRSQAESWIRLGKVLVNGQVVTKPGYFVLADAEVKLEAAEQYVGRAGLKLASVAKQLGLHFTNATVLDVGSSTGGFTDYALKRGAKKVYAVDVGTNQLHPSLRSNPKIELHEKTDIRNFYLPIAVRPDIILMDVSFVSVRELLPHIVRQLAGANTQLIVMLKPQFEVGRGETNKGVVKNNTLRRQVLHDFEEWSKRYFVIIAKRDSEVAGARGNRERFYALRPKH